MESFGAVVKSEDFSEVEVKKEVEMPDDISLTAQEQESVVVKCEVKRERDIAEAMKRHFPVTLGLLQDGPSERTEQFKIEIDVAEEMPHWKMERVVQGDDIERRIDASSKEVKCNTETRPTTLPLSAETETEVEQTTMAMKSTTTANSAAAPVPTAFMSQKTQPRQQKSKRHKHDSEGTITYADLAQIEMKKAKLEVDIVQEKLKQQKEKLEMELKILDVKIRRDKAMSELYEQRLKMTLLEEKLSAHMQHSTASDTLPAGD